MPEMPPVRDEQEAGRWLRMKAVLNVYRAHHGLMSSPDKVDWGDANPGALNLIFVIREMRKEEANGLDS